MRSARGEDASGRGVRTSPPRGVTSRFDCRTYRSNDVQDPGGLQGMVGQDSDRGDSRAERRRSGRRVDDVSRRDLETSSLASWSRALDEQRRELLAGVGHELKTPLSIVLGLCGRLLAAAELGDAQSEDVQRIRANAYVLLKRVEELLQVSRLDGGHLELEPRDVDVASLVRSSCEGFASVAEQREQRLVLEAPAAAPRASGRGEGALGRLQPAGQRAEVRAVRGHGALHRRRQRRPAAHRGRRQRPGRGRRDARDHLRALPPRRGQCRAPRGHRPRAGDRARPRGAAQRHGHAHRRARGRSAVRGRPAAQPRRRRRRSEHRRPADDRRRRAPARHRRAPAGRARRRRAPQRPGGRERAGRRSREHPHRDRRLRPRRLRRRAHRPSLRRRARGPCAGGRPPHRRPAPRRRRARRRRRRPRDRRAAPATGRGAAAHARGLARRRRRAAAGRRPRLRGQAVRRRRAAGAPGRTRRPWPRLRAARERARRPRPRLPRGPGAHGADLGRGPPGPREPLAVHAAGLQLGRAARAHGAGPHPPGRPARRGGAPPARPRAPRDRRSRHVAPGARRRLLPARVGLGVARRRRRRRRGVPAVASHRRTRRKRP